MPSSADSSDLPAGLADKVVYADDEARSLLAGHLRELCRPNDGRWEQVKHSDSRTVYRGCVGGEVVYLKHFHGRSPAHRLARKLGVSRARRELQCARLLREHGVRTPAPLAALLADGLEWVATRAVAPAEPADVWHARMLARGREGRRAIRRAIGALARLVGRMHLAGVLHGDLHCGNVLVRTDTARPTLVLSDLHRIRRRRRLSRRARSTNLAQLLHDRLDFTTRTERLRFLKHYLRVTRASGSPRGWQLMIDDFAGRHRRRQHRRRDRRIRGSNRYFARIRLGGGWSGHVVLASKREMAGSEAAAMTFTPDAWRRALADPAALLDADRGTVVKDSASSFVIRRELTVGGETLDVHLKQARRKKGWKIVPDCFRRARSVRAFVLGHKLLTRRIPTALPLAALQRRRGPLLLDSVLITETVDGLQMNHFLNKWVSRPSRNGEELDDTAKRHLARVVLRQMGRVMRKLHDSHFAHRDLKASNLIVRWDGHSAPEIALVDLDGLRHTRLLTARKRFHGLMRLNVSMLECPAVNRAGRLRMLLAYLRRPGSGLIRYKPYWRELERWSAVKLRQMMHSRRKRQKAVRGPA